MNKEPTKYCQCGHTEGAHESMDDALYGYCTKCDCHEFIDDDPEDDEVD